MKNKIVRKLLILSLSSTVALSSTVSVSAATATDTTTEQAKVASKDETKNKKTVYVAFILEDKTKVGGQKIEIPEDAGNFNASILTLPEGYELAVVGDVAVNGNLASVTLRKKAATKTVTVNYVDEKGNCVLTSSIELDEKATYFNTSILKDVPYGWEIAETGDVWIKDNKANVEVRQKEYQRDVTVNYVDEKGNSVLTSSIKLDEKLTYFNTSILKDVPYGWEIAETGDVQIKDNKATVVVRQKEYQRDVLVNYVDEKGNPVYTSSMKLDEKLTYFNTSILKDVPYGWEIAETGDVQIKDNKATVVVRQKKYQRDVIVNYVNEEGNLVLTSSIKLDEKLTYFNTSILKDVPYGWEIAETGDVQIKDNKATVVVRQKEYQRDVIVNYVDEEGNPVYTGGIKLDEKLTSFNTSILKDVPYGWEIAVVGDVQIENNKATVVVRQKEYKRDVIVNYVDEEGNLVLTGGIKLDEKLTYFNTSILKDVPYGWEIAVVGDVQIENNKATVVVRQKEYQKDILVNYVDEEGNPVLTSSMKVSTESTYINTSWLKDVPYGWELAVVGDLMIEDNAVTVEVRQKEYQRDVIINYVNEEGNLVLTSSIKLDEKLTYFNTSILKDVPYGWEIAVVGDIQIENNKATVVVRQKEYQKDILVNYVDEEGNPVLTSSMKVSTESTYINTSWLKDVPYGWELAVVGDLTIEDNAVTVVVREKEYQKDVIINYVNEEGNLVLTSSMKVSTESTYINTSWLKDVPYGWELANVGDLPIEDNKVTVVVREKEYQKDILVNYVDEEGNPVLTSSMKVSTESTYINTSWLKDVPYGWELAVVGDLTIEDNAVTVVVREKEYQRDVIINYVDEEGNLVLTSSIKLDEKLTYFNTSILKDVPYGWEIAIVGDIPVENNKATVVVRQKKYTKDIAVEYVTEDGKLVETGSLTVSEESTYINTSWLKDVPEGYEIAIVGDLFIEDGKVKVVVRETEKPDPENPNPDKPNPEKPNKPNPDKPGTKPEKPDTKPEKPSTKPEKPSKPNTNKPVNGTTVDTNKKKSPKTGDATSTAPLFAGLLGSGAVSLGMLKFLKRKKEDK